MSAEHTFFPAGPKGTSSAAPTRTAGSPSSGARADVRFSSENSLVDVPGELRLPVIARLCRERGYLFPLARPLPWLTLADACRRFPFLVDAYVSSVDGVTDSGRALSTGKAPRAATGPDLLGALCSEPPLVTCARARLRVIDAGTARVHVERCSDDARAVARVSSLLDDGRAFAVVAFAADGGFLVAALGGPGAVPDGEPAGRGGWGSVSAPAIRSARSLVPGDHRAMLAALREGGRVVAAPFMGRAAALWPASETRPVAATTSEREGGAVSLAQALLRAGAHHG